MMSCREFFFIGVFFGEKKDDPNFKVVLKKIKVENNYTSILREIYFL